MDGDNIPTDLSPAEVKQVCWIKYGLLSYLLLSVLFFSFSFFEASYTIINKLYEWNLLWLLGPPANLIYRFNWMIAYIFGTAICLPCIGLALTSKRLWVKIIFSVVSIIAWSFFGFFSYVGFV